MSEHKDVKRAMVVYAVKHGIRYKDLTGLRFNDAWGDAARGLAWRVSAHLHSHKHPEVRQSTGCTARLLWALLPQMPDAVALGYVAGYWYSHRDQTRYSYPAHNLSRMRCPKMPGVAAWTDCSGMVRCMWQQLGWPDPARSNYAVWGNSDSFIANAKAHGRLIALGSERRGDIACYVGGVGHAELVTRRGRVLTNGSDAGPYYKGIAQHSGKLYICRLAPFV